MTIEAFAEHLSADVARFGRTGAGQAT